eukprot:scaffold8005_cov67-Phaeocystis_antarctica.AAC.2
MSLEASSTPAKSPAFAGKARATAAVHPEKSARHPSARTTARITCIVVPLALPACSRVLTTSNLCAFGGDNSKLGKLGNSGERSSGRMAAAYAADPRGAGPRPRVRIATQSHKVPICFDVRPGWRRLFIHMRSHGIMTDQPKLPARPVGRQAEGLRPRATHMRAGARRGAGEGPYCPAEAAREEDAAQPQVVLALESLRAHHRGTAALIRAIEERVERHVARDERGEPAEEARSAIRTHLVKGRD